MITGIHTLDENQMTQQMLNKLIVSVQNTIYEKETDPYQKPQTPDELLKEYRKSTDKMKDVSLKERIEILIHKANSTKLTGIDSLAYLFYLKGLLFRGELEDYIEICLIKDNTTDKSTVRAIVQIWAIDENGQKYIEYYSYTPLQQLVPIKKEVLQSMFDNNELSYIKEDDKHTIYGIR